jgi:glycosyltransferase involved in cell wall biosynthesis
MAKKVDQQLAAYIKKHQRPFSCTLTVSLLVSNSIETIQNCLDSLQPLLNRVSSELIIVDTIGTPKSDGSLAIAQKYADQVIHYMWNNNFAAARNTGLAAAKGEWFLYIDDDEWFEDVSELVEFFNNRDEMNNYCSIAFHKHNYVSSSDLVYSDIMVTQCSRIFDDTKFHYPIHENLQPIVLPTKHVNCYLHHYGYADGRLENKLQRNETIMLHNLHQDPTNMHLWAQLIASGNILDDGDREKMLIWIQKAIAEYEKLKTKSNSEFINFFVIFCWRLSCLSFEKNWNGVVREGQNFIGKYRKGFTSFQYCAIDYYMCQALINGLRIKESIKIAWDILKDYLTNLQLVENDSNKDIADYTPFLHSKVGYNPFFNLLLPLLQDAKQNKNWVKINSICQQIPLQHAEDKYAVVMSILLEAILNDKHPMAKLQFLFDQASVDDSKKEESNQSKAFAAVVRKLKQDKEEKVKLQPLLAKLQGTSSYLEIQKAIFYESDSKEFKNRISNLKNNYVIDDQIDCEELFPLLIKHGVNPSFLVDKLSYDRWNQAIQEIAASLNLQHNALLPFIAKVKQIWPACIAQETLLIVLRRTYLFSNFTTISQINQQLPLYIEDALTFGEKVYSKGLFNSKNGYDLLPSEFKFVLSMKRALNYRKEKDFTAYLKQLRTALKVYPAAKYLIGKLKWQVAIKVSKQDQVDRKFQALGKQVKAQIMQLLLNGQSPAALPLVKQLAQLMPDDPETKGLLHEVLKRQ